MTESYSPEISCRQVLQKEATVFSAQWTVLPTPELSPGLLLERYLEHIRRFTFGLVRPRRTAEGVEFRFLGLPLLRFRGPSAERAGAPLTLTICGGVLVQRQSCSRGEMTFSCEAVPGGTRVSLQLADYCPLLLGGPAPSPWRRWLYRLTQAAIHQLATVRFLVRLHRELADRPVCCRVVRIRRPGERNI